MCKPKDIWWINCCGRGVGGLVVILKRRVLTNIMEGFLLNLQSRMTGMDGRLKSSMTNILYGI